MEGISQQPKESRSLPEGNYNVISFSNPDNVNRRIGGEYKPVVAAPGWGITLNSATPFYKDMVEAGKDVHALDYSRRGGKVESNGDGIREETARKAEAYADYMRSLPEGKYDLFGQSEGTMVILAALTRNPDLLDRVGNIAFMSPAGLTDNDSFVKLLGRYLGGHVPQDFMYLFSSPRKHKNVLKMSNEAGKYVAGNFPRAMAEANTIAKGGFYSLLDGLEERGINVAFIQGEDDKLTPAKALWEKIGEDAPMQIVKDETTPSGFGYIKNPSKPPIHSVTMVGGGHDNRIYAEPGFAEKVVRTFDALDDKNVYDRVRARSDNPNSGVNFTVSRKSA